jgi:hypothetical protein
MEKTELAGSDEESVSDFRFENGSVIQDVEFFRGSEPSFFDRGNQRGTVTFTVRRLHNDTTDAQLFCLDHGGSATKVGLVTFTATGGGRDGVRYANGALQPMGASFMGLQSTIQYRLSIGKILTKKPI